MKNIENTEINNQLADSKNFEIMNYQKFCSLAIILFVINFSSYWQQPGGKVLEEQDKEQAAQYLEMATNDGANHGLRVLASSNSSDFEVIDHHGVNEYLTHLQDAATELVDSIVSKSQSDFTVFDYGMYPLLFFQDEEDGSEQAFQAMIDQAENIYNAQYYLLIGKQLNPTDNSVEFRVALKLPQTGAFEQLTESFTNGIADNIRNVINDYFLNNTTSLEEYFTQAEQEGVDSLINIINVLEDLLDNGYNDDFLSVSNFTLLPSTSTPTLANDTVSANLEGFIKDYAGLKVVDGSSEIALKQ
jgi:hypothetical protein